MPALHDPRAGRRIHARLSESLTHIAGAGILPGAGPAREMRALARRIDAGARLRPERFRHFFALIRAAQGDRPRALAAAARRLLAPDALAGQGIEIRPLADAVMRPAEQRDVRRDFASPSLHAAQITRIPDARIGEIRAEISAALELVRRHAPRSHALIRAVTSEILPTRGRARHGMIFDGCSSVERWGAVLINMARPRTPLVLAETLVHESCHSYLFDLSCEERLTTNLPEERHESPLRIDPRPIDGIFHATFVLAYMHRFLTEVAGHPEAPAPLAREARALATRRAGNCHDGLGVLDAHARPTRTGRALLERIRAMVPA